MGWLFYKRRPITVYEAAERFRKQLLYGEARTAKRIRSAYRDAEKAIARDLAGLVKKIERANAAGLPIKSAWLAQRSRLEQLLQRIERQIDQYTAIAAAATAKGQAASAATGAAHAKGLAKAAGITSGFRQLSPEALADLIGTLEPGSPLYDLFRDVGVRAVSHARTVFAKAMADGANPRETAKALAQQIQGLTENRALLIARTETMRSYRTSQLRTYRANADVITGWRWQSAKNSRTCPMCLAMDGTFHGLDEGMASHPACRCMQVPTTEYSAAPKETGAEWFARQPEAIQKKTLGKTKFDLYKDGKMKLSDLVSETSHPRWGKGRTEAPLTMALANAAKRGATNPKPPKPPTPRPPKKAAAGGQPNPQYQGAASATADLSKVGRNVKAAVIESIKAIDGVHGVGKSPLNRFPVPVHEEKRMNALGMLTWDNVGGFPKRIDINPVGPGPSLTFAHEFGHALDFMGHPGAGIFKGMSHRIAVAKAGGAAHGLEPDIAAAMETFLQAASGSPEIRGWLDAKITGLLKVGKSTERVGAGEADYILQPYEIWARAYAQYVATRSTSRIMKEELKEMVEHSELRIRSRQWSTRSFKPIGEAIDAVLRSLEMIK